VKYISHVDGFVDGNLLLIAILCIKMHELKSTKKGLRLVSP
jgi:hypothetical protein